jgi:hypothetical protein
MESLSKIIIILSLIILLSLIIRYLHNKKSIELFSNGISNIDKKKYMANISEENIEFVLLNHKLGYNKYLTVIQHLPFNFNKNYYLPIGQLSIITEKEIPQKSKFFENAIKNNESVYLCASFNINPTDFEEIWNSSMMFEPTNASFSIWRPKPPSGYIALSDIIVKGRQKPNVNIMTCVPIDHTVKLQSVNSLIWKDNGIICSSVGRSFNKCINDDSNFIKYDLKNDFDGL